MNPSIAVLTAVSPGVGMALEPRGAWVRRAVAGLALFALGAARPSGAAEVSSWRWRPSLHASGLIRHRAATGPVWRQYTSLSPKLAFIPEPARTTQILNRLEHRWSLNPTRFEHYHPQLGPLFREEARLRAGLDCPPTAAALSVLLPNTPHYEFYRWRRSLNPPRFDIHHFKAPLFAEEQRVRDLIILCEQDQMQTVTPPLGPPNGETGGGGGGGQGGGGGGGQGTSSVPEPSPLALLLLGAATLASPGVARRFLGRVTTARA